MINYSIFINDLFLIFKCALFDFDFENEAFSLGTASLGTASLGTASLGTASLGTASLGTASLGTASLGTASLGTASLGTASLGHLFYCVSRFPFIYLYFFYVFIGHI